MKDSDKRGMVLKHFYDNRHQPIVQVNLSDMEGLFHYHDLQRICQQLVEKGLIEKWHPIMTGGGPLVGAGSITADGSDVVEGNTTSPISVTFDHSSSVSISDSHDFQVGNNNTQNILVSHIQGLVQAIDGSDGTQAEKSEAKSRLKNFLVHPLVVGILGSAAAAALSKYIAG